jgi:predicted phage-related endonuclease
MGRGFLGVSQIGACSRRTIYDLRNVEPVVTPEALRLMELGNLIEDLRRRELEKEGILVHGAQTEVIFGPAKGHIDGYLTPPGFLTEPAAPILWECKSTSSFGIAKWYRDGLPPYYSFQIAGYLSGLSDLLQQPVTRCHFEVINRLDGSVATWKYTVNDELTKAAMDRAIFLDRALQDGILPDREYPAHSTACQRCPFSTFCRAETETPTNGAYLDASEWPGFRQAVEQHEEAKRLKDDGETMASQARDSILDALCLHQTTKATVAGRQVVWSTVETVKLDSKSLKEAYPDLYFQYEKESSYAKLTVKEVKNT